jgi:sugar phosphate isomerase/epimerase
VLAGSALALASRPALSFAAEPRWKMRYVLGSCLYGETPLAEILPEVAKIGATHIDIWPRVHGNQREQVDEMGHDAFRALLEKNNIRVGVFTRYDLGPFGLEDEIRVAHAFGAPLIVCGGQGPKNLQGEELKQAVGNFVKRLESTLAAAERAGVTIGIENHGNNLIDSADSLRWLADFAANRPLGIALAPYHLPQDASQLAGLIEDLGPRLVHFYAWEHGQGSQAKIPKEQELMQMPGRGSLDFRPLIAALAKIRFAGFTEIFMHPFPRGIPIHEETAQVTAEINRARTHLESLIPA